MTPTTSSTPSSAPSAEATPAVTLVDTDVHPTMTPPMLMERLSARWRRHLERLGRRTPMITDIYPRARNAGMRDEAVEVMRNSAPTDGLKDDERDMINYTRELLRQNRVSDQTFNNLLKRHGERWLVEYTATIGQYQYIAAINNAFEMEPRESDDTLPVPSPIAIKA